MVIGLILLSLVIFSSSAAATSDDGSVRAWSESSVCHFTPPQRLGHQGRP